MILRHLNLEQELEWTDCQHVCELVVEHSQFFRELVKDLTVSEETKELSVSMDGKALNFDKDIDAVFNPLKLDFNSKRAMTTLLKLLVKTSVSEEYYLATNTLKSKILKYLDQIVEAEAFEFEISSGDFTIDQLAKAVSLHIVGDEDDFVELLTDYVSMMTELADVKLFVFVNLRSFLSLEEISRLHHNLNNHQINVLLLESVSREKLGKVPRILVDQDMCEI